MAVHLTARENYRVFIRCNGPGCGAEPQGGGWRWLVYQL